MLKQEIHEEYSIMKQSDVHVRINFSPGVSISSSLAKNLLRKIKEFADPDFNIMIDFRAITDISPEARKIISLISTYCPPRKIAIIVSSTASKIAGTFFLTSDRIKSPIRLYSSVEDSAMWLAEA
jgi:hypothetical protein